jgi:hypothetical protein
MNTLRCIAQLAVNINKIQADAMFKMYGRFGLYRRLYIACGFPEDTARRLEERLLAIGHEGVAEQHEILCRFVRGDISLDQLIDDWSQWYSGYMNRSCELALDELQSAA